MDRLVSIDGRYEDVARSFVRYSLRAIRVCVCVLHCIALLLLRYLRARCVLRRTRSVPELRRATPRIAGVCIRIRIRVCIRSRSRSRSISGGSRLLLLLLLLLLVLVSGISVLPIGTADRAGLFVGIEPGRHALQVKGVATGPKDYGRLVPRILDARWASLEGRLANPADLVVASVADVPGPLGNPVEGLDADPELGFANVCSSSSSSSSSSRIGYRYQ